MGLGYFERKKLVLAILVDFARKFRFEFGNGELFDYQTICLLSKFTRQCENEST